jgi:hypothetical protein
MKAQRKPRPEGISHHQHLFYFYYIEILKTKHYIIGRNLTYCGANLDEGNKERNKTREKINYSGKSSKTQPVMTQDSPTVLNTDASDLSENGNSNKWERKSESEREDYHYDKEYHWYSEP